MKRLRTWVTLLSILLVSASCAYGWLWASPYRFQEEARPVVGAALPLTAASVEMVDDTLPPAPSAEVIEPVVAKKARTPSLKNTRNILIAGLDRRADGSGPSLTDTLLVVVIDERSSHVGLISIPRDLYVDIPESGADRINTVYAIGKRSKRDALKLLAQVVNDTLQLPIEHTLVLDLGVFERAVDAVGGVDVDVTCPIADRFHDARVEGGRRLLDLDVGRQHLDGPTAAMYARSRHGRSDFHRARRQQAILMGVQNALSGLGMTKFPDLWSELESSIETDLRRIDLLGLARRALNVERSHLHGMVLGGGLVQGVMQEGKAVLLPNYEAIDEALGKLFSEASPGTEPKYSQCAPKDIALQTNYR